MQQPHAWQSASTTTGKAEAPQLDTVTRLLRRNTNRLLSESGRFQRSKGEARSKFTAYTIARARAKLRAAGIPRPPDHEALLATYLGQLSGSDPGTPALRVRMRATD